MRTVHWVWVTVGLLVWAAVVVLWATGPSQCTPPDESGHVTCRWANR